MTVTQCKRRRASGPKVKTGCSTCKSAFPPSYRLPTQRSSLQLLTPPRVRRVKCDEAKPSCQRCTSTGRKCDGYSPGFSSRDSSSLDEGPNLDIIRRITTISGNTQERRGFQFFLTNTAAELTGYFSQSFWEYFIPQASVAEPSLKHSIIAIGSLHESFSQHKTIWDKGVTPEFAITQYSKAMGHLRKSLAAGKEEHITALISCILFVCFDSLRGHLESAMVHLQSGLKVLRDIRSRPDIDKHMIETHIAPIFQRLSIQSILYLDTKRKQERHQLALNLMSSDCVDEYIPEAFETLEDARTSMNNAADGLFRMFYMCDGDVPMSAQPPESKSFVISSAQY